MAEQNKNVLHKPGESSDLPHIPDELPILPVANILIFPYVVAPLVITDEQRMALVNESLSDRKIMGLFAMKSKEEEIRIENLHKIGTAVFILKMFRISDGNMGLMIQGLSRIRLKKITQEKPFLKGLIQTILEDTSRSVKIEALVREVTELFQQIVSIAPFLPDELGTAITNVDQPGRLADLITSNLNIDIAERQSILETLDVENRLVKLLIYLNKELELLKLGSKIQSEVKSKIEEGQKEYFLREQMKAIQKELGEKDERTVEIEEFKIQIEEAAMPDEAKEQAEKELDRLAKMPPQAAEYTVSRTYLDWLVGLPWNKSTEDRLDINQAKTILDEDHYDLLDVKDRILEFLSVRKLKSSSKGPILCLVGPPGVGKTSLGRSIARAMGRKFIRYSLGGMRDEAEIRGHRRTYIGSLPGRIIQGIKKAGSNNPVFMLDEIDKVGMDFRGDPASALLEVLDPEQNFSFSDHYLEVSFDLSKVMFITTANVLDTIPRPLMDRMEVLRLPGYIDAEKAEIARRYLIPRQKDENGLKKGEIQFSKSAIRKMINEYTREAGVRNLEREIGTCCRKVARMIAEGKEKTMQITPENVSDFLGQQKFFSEVAQRKDEVGIATGLAWTPVGGVILFVEATVMPGSKGLVLTGQLGDVMKESAHAALSFIRSHAKELDIQEDFFQNQDVHIHIPEGATPKDGPSAGVTLATALASLLTKRAVKHDLAMTGEITLRGKVLPVGGIKEKVLAARRSGIRQVILPRLNEKDLEEIPENVREKMTFYFVEWLNEVFQLTLKGNTKHRSGSKKSLSGKKN
ncbi:endopeptidase La [bacterium]|nr:endopeptidase La [bacterium]RQV97498.1 MAG: endopeptidase La [bacterium]